MDLQDEENIASSNYIMGVAFGPLILKLLEIYGHALCYEERKCSYDSLLWGSSSSYYDCVHIWVYIEKIISMVAITCYDMISLL